MKTSRALLDPKAAARMASALRDVHIRFCLLWQLGCLTGLRISDLLTLKLAHFSPEDYLIITEAKTKHERIVTISPEMALEIKIYALLCLSDPDDFLFYSSERNKKKPMSRQWVNRILARTARISSVGHVSAHSMRKTYACNFFASHGSVNALKRDLMHSHLSTTMMYLRDLLPGPA